MNARMAKAQATLIDAQALKRRDPFCLEDQRQANRQIAWAEAELIAAEEDMKTDSKKLLKLLEECAEHVDDRDTEPVFEVRIPCSWQLAGKGIVACLKQALKESENEA